jgi:predicted RNase H-like HicB family nuclease
MDYIAIIHKEPNSDFGVSFPDFAGCITAGRTLDEAKDMAAEALTGTSRSCTRRLNPCLIHPPPTR